MAISSLTKEMKNHAVILALASNHSDSMAASFLEVVK